EMADREGEARRSQGQEQSETQSCPLKQDAVEKGRSRHVDHKCAHDVVETPLRIHRLERVVTADTALFARQRWINGSKHQLVVYGEKLRLRLWIGLRGKRLDCFRSLSIRWRSNDLTSLSANPTQAKIVVRRCFPVEALDRMGAKRRRDR